MYFHVYTWFAAPSVPPACRRRCACGTEDPSRQAPSTPMTHPQGHPDQAQRNAKLLCLHQASIEFVPGWYRVQHGIYTYTRTYLVSWYTKPVHVRACTRTATAVLGMYILGIGRHNDKTRVKWNCCCLKCLAANSAELHRQPSYKDSHELTRG